MSKLLAIRFCSQCGKEVLLTHKHRLKNVHIFCDKGCEALFRTAPPNTRCIVCGKPIHVKQSRQRDYKEGVYCSKSCSAIKRAERYAGKGNPNHRYDKNLDLFYNLTPDGAYILGFIYSDGSISTNSVAIYQQAKYKNLLGRMSELIFGKDLTTVRGNSAELIINDKQFVQHLLSLGGIVIGKKSGVVEMPNIPEELKWSFICGYFDGDGGFKYDYRYPSINIASNSSKMLSQIASYWGVSYEEGRTTIHAQGYKALDICGRMYDSCSLHHPKKYTYYTDILNWEPYPNNGWQVEEYFRYKRYSKEAVAPVKSRVTDSGFDVHALEFIPVNEALGIYMADTRLAIEPIPGHYFDLIGRSSLPMNNLHFLGGVGVIDRSYTGSLKMLVQKLDLSKELPLTPFKIGQLIPRKIFHAKFIEVNEFEDTDRGMNGFGSTGIVGDKTNG